MGFVKCFQLEEATTSDYFVDHSLYMYATPEMYIPLACVQSTIKTGRDPL